MADQGAVPSPATAEFARVGTRQAQVQVHRAARRQSLARRAHPPAPHQPHVHARRRIERDTHGGGPAAGVRRPVRGWRRRSVAPKRGSRRQEGKRVRAAAVLRFRWSTRRRLRRRQGGPRRSTRRRRCVPSRCQPRGVGRRGD